MQKKTMLLSSKLSLIRSGTTVVSLHHSPNLTLLDNIIQEQHSNCKTIYKKENTIVKHLFKFNVSLIIVTFDSSCSSSAFESHCFSLIIRKEPSKGRLSFCMAEAVDAFLSVNSYHVFGASPPDTSHANALPNNNPPDYCYLRLFAQLKSRHGRLRIPLLLADQQKRAVQRTTLILYGGSGGIRTHEPVRTT